MITKLVQTLVKAFTPLCVRHQKALLLSFIASKLHNHDKKKWIYFTYLTIKAVIALIVTVLSCLEPKGMQNYTLWYCGAHLAQWPANPDVDALKITTQHWFTGDLLPPVSFFTKSTLLWNFPVLQYGNLEQHLPQFSSFQEFYEGATFKQWTFKKYRDHSCSSDKKEAKTMESGKITALLLSVSEAVWASAWVTSLRYDSLYLQSNSSSQLQTQSSSPSTKQGHSLEWCWLKTVHNCKWNTQ